MTTMSKTVAVERSAPAVRAVLAELDPEACAEFEAEFHTAMAEADDDFDTSRVDGVISRWWARAYVLVNPDPEAVATWDRIKAGDESDIVASWRRQPDGSQHVYRKDEHGAWTFSHVIPPAQKQDAGV